nr:synaptonemal complex protein 1 isoform X5 [Pelodiscus sinensis]|eukprot:XP_025038277.1 synaptonemal complex protein 1 isoform X5 [Pelodiscus sinensis]
MLHLVHPKSCRELVVFNKCTEEYFSSPMTSIPNHGEVADSGNAKENPVSQKINFLPRVEEENVETMHELYSKLYKEAEKIKRWKATIESELKQKERKLQENKKIIEAQRKAIQELQFENEKLSLKLEDEICENKDLLQENTATRHLCNLLKETCARYTEKSNKYEHEREETRHLYVTLNNNIERMILAFEELRVQAENSRLEMCFKLKEAAEKVEQLEKEYKMEISVKEKQLSILTVQSGEKDNKIRDTKLQLQESRDKIIDLEEATKQQKELLKESQNKQKHLMGELEEAKVLLQKTETAQKSLETELRTAMKTLIEVTGEKEAQMEELTETRALHASVVEEFETANSNLKELLKEEQNRLKKLEEESELLVSELQNKSLELEEMAKLKSDKETQLEDLTEALERSLKCQKNLEQQLASEQSEKIILIKEREIKDSDHSDFQEQVQGLLSERKHLEIIIEELQKREKEMKDILQIREKEVHNLEVQLTGAAEKEQNCIKQITALNADLEKEMLRNEELNMNCNKILLEKEQIAQEKSDSVIDLKKLQEVHKDNRKKEEKTKKLIENLEEMNSQLREEKTNINSINDLESLKEKMKKKDEEAKTKLDESEENARNIGSEISRKEKQLKMLENKFNNLKKQVENKTKYNEELQQENKVLKKKIAAESKQSSIYEGKVNKLQLELENVNRQHKETVESYQKEIESKNIAEEKVLEKIEKMRLMADEAVCLQKETDIRCQHKITEMVALMEKHKHQYDKMVEEKDSELELCKTKEQEQISVKKSLETELSHVKNELLSLKEQFKIEIEEKEKLIREAKENGVSKKEKKHKKIQTSFIETPKTSLKLASVNSEKSLSQNFTPFREKKLENKELSSQTPAKSVLGTPSLKSIVSEEEMFKKLYKNCPQASHLCVTTSKKITTPSTIKSPGAALKLTAMRRMRETGWTAVSKIDRKKKMKEAEKLFA